MERKTDRRSRKTQNAIKESYIKLLSEKPHESITVKEITDLADIHRATFYTHYVDTSDLRSAVENDFYQNLTAIMEDRSIVTYQDFYDVLLNYVQENPDTAGVIFRDFPHAADSALTQELVQYFVLECETAWQEEAGILEISEELEYFSYYRIHGILGLIGHWIRTDCSIPIEQLKRLISDLDETVDTYMLSRHD